MVKPTIILAFLAIFLLGTVSCNHKLPLTSTPQKTLTASDFARKPHTKWPHHKNVLVKHDSKGIRTLVSPGTVKDRRRHLNLEVAYHPKPIRRFRRDFRLPGPDYTVPEPPRRPLSEYPWNREPVDRFPRIG